MEILRNVFRAAVWRFNEQSIHYRRYFLSGRKTVKGLNTSTKNTFVWRKRDQDSKVKDKASGNLLSPEEVVRITYYKDSLSLDFEDVKFGNIPHDTQQLHEAITTLVEPSLPAIVNFNHILECMYISGIKSRMGRLGYSSYFQRYNDDHGIAVFHKKKEEV
ncbi:hypothetical protein CHS0354_028772 [Potamilus streckersoni]|uniref:Uncharacterized protein n=1 Tax=Potamilus streckersoni TaxID=2493646 RepID=A0AAE0S9P9_9BIVA|nr:hypothetical protein CHS0354_028772 [Potamilus streckersoni]